MSTTPPFARLFVTLAAFAAAVAAPAQVLTHFNTINDYKGSDIAFGTNAALSQTFTNVVYIQSMTYRFIRSSGSSVNVNWYFVEWDTATNRALTEIASGSISVPAAGSFSTYDYLDPQDGLVEYLGYDHPLTLDYTANAATTYAMVLVASSNSLKLGLVDGPSQFPFGSAFRTSNVSNFADLTTTSGSGYAPIGADWGFSQLSVELAAIPEPSTAAAAIGALLVAGLIALRVMRRRQEQAAALVPVATK